MVIVWAITGTARAEKPVFRKPPPEGVVEIVGVAGTGSSLVGLKDGSLMVIKGGSYRISKDAGITWGESRSFGQGASGNGIVRLKSGALALMRNLASGGNLEKGWLGAAACGQDDGDALL